MASHFRVPAAPPQGAGPVIHAPACALPASHEGMILWAMVALMTRRLAQAAH
jgi:hypothetical protein